MVIGIDASRAFSPFVGGPENYSYYLIRALLKAGSPHQFHLYLRPDSSRRPRFSEFFSGLSNLNYQISIVRWPFLWTQGGLALECLRNPPDVLFVPAHTIPIIRRPGLKTVVVVHDLGAQFLPNYHKFPQKLYLNFATDYALRHATQIIAVSRYTKKTIEENVKCPMSNVKCVYEGYDRGLFYPRNETEITTVKEKYRIDGDYLLFVGTIQPRKNLVRLIEAYSKLKCQMSNVKCQLILAGSPGWLDEEIYEAPGRFGVADRVRFIGHIDDESLPALLSGCRAFVFPSLYEGFGLSLLEAMACGAVAVTSAVTSLPEVGGDVPFYVDPYDAESIAVALKKVLELRDEEKMSIKEKSLEQAGKFSWEDAAKQVLSIFELI